MGTQFNLGDYVDVKERINLALAKYPELSLQFEFKGTLESNPEFIWGIAYAYRTPDDPRPGIGTACELAIGKTTFSRGSEVMVLETSCWGRALGALGIGLGKSIATRQEVEAAQNRNEPETDAWGLPIEQPAPISEPVKPIGMEMTEKQYALIKSLFNYSFSAMNDYVNDFKVIHGIPADKKLDKIGASKLIEELKAAGYVAGKKPNNPDPESKYE
jgi:hypothetical protein